MTQVYIVIDSYVNCNYRDIVLGIYSTFEKAEESKLCYESSIAKRDTNRFKIITENLQ